MSEETNQTPEPKEENSAGVTISWLFLAFVPSLASIPLMKNGGSPNASLFLLFLTGACCLSSAFGILRGVKSQVTRIVLGLLLAGFLFVLNAFIVILIGCSNMKI